MFTFQIPSDGSSVPAADFAKAADSAVKEYREKNASEKDDPEFGQLSAAVSAAKSLVGGGHVGEENVYVIIGGIGGSDLSVGVHHRAAPKPPVEVPVVPAPALPSPYYTGPKPDEIAREVAARAAAGDTRATTAKVAADLGATAVTGVSAGAPARKLSGAAAKSADAKAAKAAEDAAAALAGAPAAPAARSPYDAGSPTEAEKAHQPAPAEGSSAALGQEAGPATAPPPSTAADVAAGQVAGPIVKAPAVAPVKAARVRQSNPKTPKPAAGAVEKKVAADRAGK